MRLERLGLAPYGRFEDRTLSLSETASLHVVFGRNEAGKTTMLEAIADFLFGFPHSARYALGRDQQLLRIGGALRFADGSRLEAVRRKGRQNTLLDQSGRPVADEPLLRALAGIDRDMFREAFGLTATSLRAGGAALLAADGELAESLAAGSGSLAALNATRKRLNEEKDELFTPQRRSASKRFDAAVLRHTAAARALKAASVDGEEWKAAQSVVEQAKLRGIDLQEKKRALDAAVTRRKRALRVRGKLAALAATTERLAALAPTPDISVAMVAETRKALADDAAHRTALAEFAAEDAECERALADLRVDERIVAQKSAVEALVRQIGAAENFERDLPHRLSEEEEARLQLDGVAGRLGLAGAAELLTRHPTEAELARARALVERFRRADERRREAEKGRREAKDALARLAAPALDALDPEGLKRRLQSFDAALDEARTLAKDRAAQAREAQALAERAAALDPPVADLDALARAPLPDEPTLARRADAERAAQEALRAAQAKLAEAKAAARARDEAVSRLAGVGAISTRADWDRARAQRDAALDKLAAALEGPRDAASDRLESARALTHAADAVAERLLRDAALAAELHAARGEAAKARADAEACEAVRADAQDAWTREIETTRALWAPSGVPAAASARMTDWRRAAADLLRQREKGETRRAELDATASRVEAARETLAGWLAEAGVAAAGAVGFEELHRIARDRLETLEAAWRLKREAEIARAEVDRTLASHDRLLAECEAAQAQLRQDWPAAMARLGLRPEAAPEEAEAALAAWSAVGVPREKLRAAGDRIEKIRAGLAAFEREAAAVVAAAAPDLDEPSGLRAAGRLAERLAAAIKAVGERERLRGDMAKRAARRAGVEAARAACAEGLGRAREILGAADDIALETALARAEERAELEKAAAALRRDLVDMGEGLDEARLRAEQAEFDFETLGAEIAQAEEAQERIWADYKRAGEEEAAAQSRLDTLAAGRDAAGAARERAEAAGEIAETAERWLLRAVAANLAGRAIERHRAAAQVPVIARAGELFAIATAASFAGLGVGYDKADRPILVARRPRGETVDVEGLSEGARDQLYLSLRLALLEQRAGEPLPFIGDDLLASFDDERTRHTLDLLAEFGGKRQTLLFTHHARVAELAGGLSGRNVEVVEI